MMIYKKLKELFVPVNQPVDFPTFYLIPSTQQVEAPRASANDGLYEQAPIAHIPTPSTPPATACHEGIIERFKRRQIEKLEKICAEAWSATKAFGRRVVRWLAWRVFLPLSVLACTCVPLVNPAELPL